jgi:hypothetical protein
MIGDSPEVSNFHRLFLKLHRFICNQPPGLPEPWIGFPTPMWKAWEQKQETHAPLTWRLFYAVVLVGHRPTLVVFLLNNQSQC